VILTITFLPTALLFAGEPSDDYHATLNQLASDFKGARALPAGSCPSPPDLDLKALLGSNSTRLRSALGPPDRPVRGSRPKCGADLCWTFRYGPKPNFAHSAVAQENGLNSILVATGGPFLLIVGISSNRVETAEWLGQR
jgi:hypothetical protein